MINLGVFQPTCKTNDTAGGKTVFLAKKEQVKSLQLGLEFYYSLFSSCFTSLVGFLVSAAPL